MPLVRRKNTILRSIRNVLLAPVLLIFALVLTNRWWLLLALVLMVFCMWMAREPLGSVAPDMETLITLGLVFCFIAVAAIPLAIRDYLSNGGYETIWQPDDRCLRAARQYAESLIREDFRSLRHAFNNGRFSEESFDTCMESILGFCATFGPPETILDANELAIGIPESADSPLGEEIDAVVEVVCSHHEGATQSVLTICLNCRDDFRVVDLQIAPYET